MDDGRSATRSAIERVFREESGRVLATLTRIVGDLDLAEEAVQDAFVTAMERWPAEGLPRQPGAWITTTARRRAIDRLRRDRRYADKLAVLAAEAAIGARASLVGGTAGGETGGDPDGGGQEEGAISSIADDRLRLIFTCCHPALGPEARVALTLRTLGGLQTAEIARAFLVPEATLAQRLARAKRKIRAAGIPYAIPPDAVLPERLDSVLTVLYLIFNEGYLASSGDAPVRRELCAEAIRLARLLAALMPDEPEALGLLALVLLHDARREARADAAGDIVLLEDQDRERWDQAQIGEGLALLARAGVLGPPGPYQVQAAIAAEHDRAATAEATDWARIAAHYAVLVGLSPSPVVRLNQAVAVAMAAGPEAGLRLLEGIAEEPHLAAYHLFHAARADLLRRSGRFPEAATAYARALALTPDETERRFLRRRLAEVRRPGSGSPAG